MQFSVEGLENVQAMIDDKINNLTEKLSEGIAESCKVVEADARGLCPVDTGELQKSITSEVSGTTGTVGTNKEYAMYVEFGTYKMEAQPYLVPALKSNEETIVEIIKGKIAG